MSGVSNMTCDLFSPHYPSYSCSFVTAPSYMTWPLRKHLPDRAGIPQLVSSEHLAASCRRQKDGHESTTDRGMAI